LRRQLSIKKTSGPELALVASGRCRVLDLLRLEDPIASSVFWARRAGYAPRLAALWFSTGILDSLRCGAAADFPPERTDTRG